VSLEHHAKIELASSVLKDAEALLIGAGAGMSVDSGIPAYRRNPEGGVIGAADRPISFLPNLSPMSFDIDAEVGWGAAGYILDLFRNTKPHEGYQLLHRWGAKRPGGFFVLTSNIDGQFDKAGFRADRILEGHGSVHHLQCTKPCGEHIWSAESTVVGVDTTTMRARPPLPRCPSCGAAARPNVFMFGDRRFNAGRAEQQQRSFDKWLDSLDSCRLVVVECGAGTAVPTIRRKCEELAKRFDGTLIRINLTEPDVPSGGADAVSLPLGALDALRQIDACLS
jgi:NAD-dependent SIR2 family protein deacetylase